MILMIVGAIILVITIMRFDWLPLVNSKDFLWDNFKATLCIVVGMLVMVAGFGVPLHGFDEPTIAQEYPLVELIEGTDIYVIQDSNRKPFFKYDSESYTEGINDLYAKSNVELVVSNKYEKPTLVKCNQNPKRSLLTFALFGNGAKYQIYVSEENVKKFN